MDFNRYLINFDTKTAIRKKTDVLVIGCGICALYASLLLSEKKDVILLTSGEKLREHSDEPVDPNLVNYAVDFIKPFDVKDAVYAGSGLTAEQSLLTFLANAEKNAKRLNSICGLKKTSLPFEEKTRENQDTILYYLRADDFVESVLCDKVRENEKIDVIVPFFACDLLTKKENDKVICYGVVAKNFATGETMVIEADVVLLSQNGYKGIYDNHYHDSYGDDIAMFLRAGGEAKDMELVHFWPMVLNSGDGKELVIVPNQMLDEGAILRNIEGERFMQKYSDLGEFASSSTVARAIEKENRALCTENVYVDITFKDSDYLKCKYKSLYDLCMARGIDISNEYIPIKTKAGFCIGGIETDEIGRTSIKNVYVCSSDANNGFFGARLTRRSVIPYKIVFAGIAVDDILGPGTNIEKTDFVDISCAAKREPPCSTLDVQILAEKLRRNNESKVGILRDSDGLNEALNLIKGIKKHIERSRVATEEAAILQNMVMISELVAESALERRESRGAHYRDDYPETDNARFRRHIYKKLH